MKAKFAKALSENITTIAGNVAHVALIDAKVINDDVVFPTNPAALVHVVREPLVHTDRNAVRRLCVEAHTDEVSNYERNNAEAQIDGTD